MQKHKILELLNSGQIEEAKSLLRDEIYMDSLKIKPGAKQRYNAMKRYCLYNKGFVPVFERPRIINFEGVSQLAFYNKYSVILTSELDGNMELSELHEIPGLERLIQYEGVSKEIDLNKIFAEAKSKGYKLKKSGVISNYEYKYLFYYDEAYFRIAILDAAFSIINNGERAIVFHKDNDARAPLIIKNNIGVCAICPCIPYTDDKEILTASNIVIEAV